MTRHKPPSIYSTPLLQPRIRILLLLSNGSATWKQLKEMTGLPQNTLAYNLQRLLLDKQIEKTDNKYRLTPNGEITVKRFKEILKTICR